MKRTSFFSIGYSLVTICLGGVVCGQVSAAGQMNISGLMELEGQYINNAGSEMSLATVEINVEQKFSETLTANIVLLHEDTETPLGIEEGTITLSRFVAAPVSMVAGKMVIPFGKFESALISDPLTLEMAETNRNALQLNFHSGKLTSSVFVFGESEDSQSSSAINTRMYGLGLDYARKGWQLGVSYLHNLAQAEGLQAAEVNSADLVNTVSGAASYISSSVGNVEFVAEYITAIDMFRLGGDSSGDKNFKPSVYQLELIFNIGKHQLVAGYQGTKDAQQLDLPRNRTSLGANFELQEATQLAVELGRESLYKFADNTGEPQLSFVTQLAVSF